jgi:putative ABC transport system permease protein
MTSLFHLIGLRPLARRWDRSLLVIASIALGVATLVSSRILNERIESAAQATTTPLKSTADLYLSNSELGIDRQVSDDLRNAAIPGVRDVRPLLYERIELPELGRSGVLIGADLSEGPKQADELLQVEVTLTDTFAAVGFGLGRGTIVSKQVYEARRVAVPGDGPLTITMRVGNKTKSFPIAGYFTLKPDSPAAAFGLSVVGMELAAAAKFLKGDGPVLVNRIDIAYLPKADGKSIENRVREVVGPRGTIETAETRGQASMEIVNGMKIGFTLCSLGAMIVGMFLVYNAMSVTVTEQRPEIGMIRSIGATRGQVMRTVVGGAALLGFIGALFGVPLGVALANYAMSQFRELLESIFLSPDATFGWPDGATVLMAITGGMAVSLFAAFVPAIQAVRDDPARVAKRSGGRVSFTLRMIHLAICGLLIGSGIAMIMLRMHLPTRLGGFGGLMIALVGLLVGSPLIVGGILSVINPCLRTIIPIEGRIAADNLLRSPGRTGLVIGALAAGVAVMVQTAGVAYSNERPFTGWIDQILRADMYVFGGNMATGTSSGAPMDPRIVPELASQPGITRTTAIRFSRPHYNGTLIYVIALDTREFSGELLRRGFGPPDIVKYQRVTGTDIVVSENFAVRHGIKPGDTVTLGSPNGPVSLNVIDTVIDYSWSRGTIVMERSAYARLFSDSRIDLVHIFLDGSEAGRQAAEEYCTKQSLTLVERDVAHRLIVGLVDRLNSLAYVQQIVVGLVASLGVVTALLISVIQRKRELGLLIAIGATPGQVIRSVLWEALLMGLFGIALGFITGAILAWFVLRILIYEETGFTFAVLLPPGPIALIAFGALGMATLAGLIPAWNAVRTDPVDALVYE